MTNTNQTKGTMFQMTTEEGLEWERLCVTIPDFKDNLDLYVDVIEDTRVTLLIGSTENRPLVAAIPVTSLIHHYNNEDQGNTLQLPKVAKNTEYVLTDFNNKLPITKLPLETLKKFIWQIIQEINKQNYPLLVKAKNQDVLALVPLETFAKIYQPLKPLNVHTHEDLDKFLEELLLPYRNDE